jgi:deoxyadenosine/deoxycytidine kinase
MAVGKSTLGQLLIDGWLHNQAVFVAEPDSINPFLPLYLQDPTRWGFTAQLRYGYDYAAVHAEAMALGRSFCFLDGGFWLNRDVYIRYLADRGLLSAAEVSFYHQLLALICAKHQLPQNPDALIWVDAPPEISCQRMHHRGWKYQTTTVNLEYIRNLSPYFEQMAAQMGGLGIPVLKISSQAINFMEAAGAQQALTVVQTFFEAHHLLHAG